MYDDFIRAVAGGVAGLFCTFLAYVATSIRDTAAKRRKARALDDMSKQVAFWELLLRAQQLAAAPELEETRRTACVELNAALEAFLKLRTPVTEFAAAASTGVPRSTLRRTLLLYRPQAFRAWLPRAFFYLASIYFVAVVVSLILFLVNNQFHVKLTQLVFVIVTLVAILSFAWLFRYLSVRLEKSASA